MIVTAKLKDTTIELNLPEKATDVSLEQFVQFHNAHSLYVEAVSDNCDEVTMFKRKLHCVESYFDRPIEDFTFTNSFGTVNQLFQRIAFVIGTYQPSIEANRDYKFSHKGINFTMPYFLRATVIEKVDHELTVGETVEVLEAKRLCKEIQDKNNSLYNSLVSLLAILSREVYDNGKFEQFPIDQKDIDIFIEERRKLFADINFTHALDAGFFLTNIIYN